MTADQFQQRFLPLQQRLYQQALALLGDEANAMDAVQEVYLRLWQQADRVGQLEKPDGFFIQTLRNICLNMIRSRRGLASIEQMKEEAYEENTELRQIIQAENRLRLRRAIGQLPTKARSMVTMFYFSQMSSLQIAETTGETDANVRSTLSRARATLRKLLLDNPKKDERRY